MVTSRTRRNGNAAIGVSVAARVRRPEPRQSLSAHAASRRSIDVRASARISATVRTAPSSMSRVAAFGTTQVLIQHLAAPGAFDHPAVAVCVASEMGEQVTDRPAGETGGSGHVEGNLSVSSGEPDEQTTMRIAPEAARLHDRIHAANVPHEGFGKSVPIGQLRRLWRESVSVVIDRPR